MSLTTSYIALSQSLLYAVRTEAPHDEALHLLEEGNEAELLEQLSSDEERKAFWLNLYNAFVQIFLKEDPELYHHRHRFFTRKSIPLAGRKLSLDAIEHGVLRRSRIKWGFGYLTKPIVSGWEKAFRVAKVDYRIHFALNCGARSCPPIAFYRPEVIDTQLDLATPSYLSGEAYYDAKKNTLYLPAIMGWFRGDFGGKSGMKALLQQHKLWPEGAAPRIRFRKYDWSLYLNHYKNENYEQSLLPR